MFSYTRPSSLKTIQGWFYLGQKLSQVTQNHSTTAAIVASTNQHLWPFNITLWRWGWGGDKCMEVRVQCPGCMEDSSSNFLLRLIQCPHKYVNQFHVHSSHLDQILKCKTREPQLSHATTTNIHIIPLLCKCCGWLDDTIKVGKVCK
jgi:hypothetical protein